MPRGVGCVDNNLAPKRSAPSLLPQGELWFDKGWNVLLMGPHGTGKSETIIDLAKNKNIKMKYYSCSTLDPYTDLVGVPFARRFCQKCDEYFDPSCYDCPRCKSITQEAVKMVRPRDLDQAEFIFFDELNRADPKTLNAVLEIIQFRSVNGEPLPKLKCCWAAINPPDEDDTYQVEELDPALADRFDLFIPFQPKPSVEYMSKYLSNSTAQALKYWWDEQNREKRGQASYVSPRRLLKLGLIYEATSSSKTLRQALPPGVQAECGKLIKMLEAAKQGKSFKESAKNIGDSSNPSLKYDSSWLMGNKAKAAKILRDNPNNLETHKKVLTALSSGISGTKLGANLDQVLEPINPALLEGWVRSLPAAKASQLRNGFRSQFRTEKEALKKRPNLVKALSKGASGGSLW